MKQQDYFKFYVFREPELLELPPENAGTLYVGNTLNETTYWFDNDNYEWNQSLYAHSKIANDPEFKQVNHFDNGYVSSDDAIYYLTTSGKVILPASLQEEISM